MEGVGEKEEREVEEEGGLGGGGREISERRLWGDEEGIGRWLVDLDLHSGNVMKRGERWKLIDLEGFFYDGKEHQVYGDESSI